MNTDWAIDTLRRYIALLDEYDASKRKTLDVRAEKDVAVDLDRALSAVQAIAERMRPGYGKAVMASGSPGHRRYTITLAAPRTS